MDMTIPAPSGSTESAASQVTTQNTVEQSQTPQAEKPAGDTPQGDSPAGEQQETASDQVDQSQDDDQNKPKTWKEKRQERNKQRWQEYKQAKEVIPARMAMLEREIASLKGVAPPDFSQIQDPTEEIAKRAAWEVRQQNVAERQAQLEQERQRSAYEQQIKMAEAWTEAVEDAKARIPNFEEHAARAPVHERAAPFIVESEKAAEIVYWLGDPKNKAAAEQLFDQFATAPTRALIELGKLEARLSAPAPKTISTAPKPANTLGGGVNPLNFDASRASVDDFAQQLRKAGVIR